MICRWYWLKESFPISRNSIFGFFLMPFELFSLYILNHKAPHRFVQNVPCRWDCMFSSKLCVVMYCRHAPTNVFFFFFFKCCWFYLKKMYLFSLKIKYLFKEFCFSECALTGYNHSTQIWLLLVLFIYIRNICDCKIEERWSIRYYFNITDILKYK